MFKKILFSSLVWGLLSSFCYADDLNSPVGLWQTISDETKKPSSLVKITNHNGVLVGQIVQLLPGSHFKPVDLCSHCPGSFKNQPIVGLQFLWDFVADEHNKWTKGRVLDPISGHIYKGTLQVVEAGKKMELRGYWGPFWRTQTWTRV